MATVSKEEITELSNKEWSSQFRFTHVIWGNYNLLKKNERFKAWRKEIIENKEYLIPGIHENYHGIIYITNKIIDFNTIVKWKTKSLLKKD